MKTIKRRTNRHLLAIVLVLSLSFDGCSTLLLPDYELDSIDKYQNSKTINGLTIVVHPLKDSEESEKYFGVDFNKTELLPVLIIINNQSPESSYIIEKEKFILISEQTYLNQKENDLEAASDMAKRGSATNEAASVALVAGLLFFTPLAVVAMPIGLFGANKTCNAKEIKRNMLENEYQTTTVSASKSTHGFIYFTKPKDKTQTNNFILRIDANNLKQKSIDRFEFYLSL